MVPLAWLWVVEGTHPNRAHLVRESPRLYYIHFWADGAPDDVVKGLRGAVDAAR